MSEWVTNEYMGQDEEAALVETMLIAEHYRDGKLIDTRVVKNKAVTTSGLTALMLYNGTKAVKDFNYHDCGTGGATAESAANTGLTTPAGTARVAGTPTNPSALTFRSVATISFTSTLAISEHGIFDASTAGTMLDRTAFSGSPINVVSGDSIQFTFEFSMVAGG